MSFLNVREAGKIKPVLCSELEFSQMLTGTWGRLSDRGIAQDCLATNFTIHWSLAIRFQRVQIPS